MNNKKTLLIDARLGGDWGQDLLFAGCVKLLGYQNVIDYPYHGKHRETLEFSGNAEYDWGLERRTLGYTEDNLKVKSPDDAKILEMLKFGEIERIFIDERDESYALYLRLKANFFNVPVVIVAGHDKFLNESLEKVILRYGKNFEAMFVDNFKNEYRMHPKVYPYNWSVNFDHYWNQNRNQAKIYDISFQGYNSHPDRAVAVDHILSKWSHLRLNVSLERAPDTMVSYSRKCDYFNVMARSKICLNLRGAAQNGKTLRFFEIPYVGSAMLTQDSHAVQLHELQNRKHCLYFENLDMLDDQIEWALSDTDRLKALAASGHEHVMRYHTVLERVKHIHEVLNGQA